MKSGSALVVAVAVVLAGCANGNANGPYKAYVDSVLTAPHNSAAEIAAPNALEPKPWKVGQWVLYKRRDGNDVGYEKLSVVADDPCGMWIEKVIQQYDARWKWTFCVHVPNWPRTSGAELRVLITQRGREEPAVFDFRNGRQTVDRSDFDWVVSQVSASWRGAFQLPRETIRVPAGRFSEAVKVMAGHGTSSRWSHPDVPFDGRVKELSADGSVEKVLLAYGDTGATSVLPELAEELRSALRPKATPRLFFGLGLGFNWVNGTGTEASRANAVVGQFGLRVASELDLVALFGAIDSSYSSPDSTLGESAGFGLLAVRWSPFRTERHRRRARGVYVQGGIGYAELDRASNNNARGFVAAASVGLLALDGHDWTVGIELSDQVSFYNSREGMRNSFGLSVFYQLYIPALW